MTLLDLRYFCVVAKHESISKAANELIVSQPSLSKTIRGLEAELGTDLLVRKGRELQLSDSGRYFYENVCQSLNILDNAVNTLSSTSVKKEISICINCADLFIEDALVAFHKLHPDVSFIINTDIFPEQASRTGNDLTVVALRGTDNVLSSHQHFMYTESFGLVVPKADPLAQREEVDLIEARDRRFIGTAISGLNRLMCQEVGFTPQMIIAGQNIHAYMKMVECGTGVTIAPRISVAPYLPESCVFVPLKSPSRNRTVILEESSVRHIAPHVTDFINFCAEKARQYPLY